MYVTKHEVQILALRHISVGMYDKLAKYALAAKTQKAITPFVVERDKIIIFLRGMNALGNLSEIVRHARVKKSCRGVKEIHCPINANPYVHIEPMRQPDDIFHILKGIPRGKAEHERHGHFVFQFPDHLNDLVMPVRSTHLLISLLIAVERNINMSRMISPCSLDDPSRRKTVGEQRVVRMIFREPPHDGIGLRM